MALNTRAQAAKEKGNAAFKGGNYSSAIGYYTEAILADTTDPTLPLNRAAAYLKLGKNEDAERDSTTTLKLSPSHIKALFRRAQARGALGKLLEARQDLNDALAIEPNNTSIREELKKVDQLVAIEKFKKAKAETARASFPTPGPIASPSASNPSPKRRRVPIEIVEPPSYRRPSRLSQSAPATEVADVNAPVTTPPPATKPKVETDTLTPVSTRSLKSPSPSSVPQTQPYPAVTTPNPTASTTPSTSTVPPKPSTFTEAKSTRDSSKSSPVGSGGGIFRANGQNTLFSPRSQTSASVSTASTLSAGPASSDATKGEAQQSTNVITRFPLNIPSASGTGLLVTMFNFNKAWEASPSTKDRWRLITSVTTTNIPSMCKSSLEPSLFISIIDVFREVVELNGEQDQDTREVIKAYLKAFEDVPRFNTVLLFLSEKEKSRVRELWKVLDVSVENLSGGWNVIVR